EPLDGLTPTERRVARLIANGMTNRDAADALKVSPHTVDSHLRHIFGKLGITSRAALARMIGESTEPER
ncbi:MAG TPA: helix-turn-helix transcriptional regulator, partial [Rugosimonospora sp.]|nr:helix-turn-helix transcriptional regulator [Rugosimonospora sp.]